MRRSPSALGSVRLSPVVLALAGVMAFVPVQSAQATCIAIINKDAATSAASATMKIAAAGILFTNAVSSLVDALSRYANEGDKNIQRTLDAQTVATDKITAGMTSTALGVERSKMVLETMPSRVACIEATKRAQIGATLASYRTNSTGFAKKNNAYSTGGAGSGSEKGNLQAAVTVWNDRCNKYANVAVLKPPSGCSGPSDPKMIDLDIKPWEAMLDPISFKSDAYKQAAVDTIRMLTEVTPPDHVKGAALLRNDGKNLHVLRMRDVSRMNLARGVLEDVVSMRVIPSGDTQSRLGRYIEAVNGQPLDPNTNTLSGALPAVLAAREPTNATAQTLTARLATQQAMIFEIMNLLEKIVAVESVGLAIRVENSKTSATASRATSTN